jgi:hypothetical protein
MNTQQSCELIEEKSQSEIELWKSIPDFPHYKISSLGRVFNERNGKYKKSHHDHKGYKRLRLIDGSKGSTKKIHRLVAQAFIANYSKDLQVNHKNCIKDDNRVSNLEMCNQSENTKHAWKNNRMKLLPRDAAGRFVKDSIAKKRIEGGV